MKSVGRKDDDRRAVLEPTQLLAFAVARIAGDDVGAAMAQVEQHVETTQAYAGDKDGGDRDQGHRMAAGREPGAHDGAFVLAEQPLDPPERDRIDVPGIARHVDDAFDAAVVRRVEAVIHARGEPQRDITAVAVRVHEVALGQEFAERVRKSLGLVEPGAGDRAASADDGVARAHQDVRPAVDRARAVLELADEAIVHAAEARFLRLPQVEIGKEPPRADRQIAHQRLLDAAEPADELRDQPARNAVGEQEIDVLLLQDAQKLGADRHGAVNSAGYTAIRWSGPRRHWRSMEWAGRRSQPR